ncbi:MAG: hypothetical protein RL684_2439 [Pseudomonadota bacterium]|jgi:ketosteroid isomerase-like protein
MAMLATALLAMSAAPVRAADAAAEARALAALNDKWAADTTSKDADRVAAYYAENALLYPPGGALVRGRAAARKVWADMLALPQFQITWKTQHSYVSKSGELGYTSGNFQNAFKDKDGKLVKESGKFLCVWEKQADGSWKAVHDMWNSDAP